MQPKKKKKFWEIPLVHGGFCGNISLVLCNISRPAWHLFLVSRLKKKPIIPNRFKKERTLSLHGSSSMRLCYFFGLKEKDQFQARGWEWEAQVRFWTFRSESVKEYKITPLWSLLSNHRQSTRWHRPDGHPGGIHRARAGSEPCRTELFKSKKERKTGLVFLFPGVPYYFYMFFISVASDRNLHSKVRRSGPMMPIDSGAHMQVNVLDPQCHQPQANNWCSSTHPQTELVVPGHQVSPEVPFLKVLPKAGPHSKGPGHFCLCGPLSP